MDASHYAQSSCFQFFGWICGFFLETVSRLSLCWLWRLYTYFLLFCVSSHAGVTTKHFWDFNLLGELVSKRHLPRKLHQRHWPAPVLLFHLQAERCSLFLVDRKQQELVAKVFDGNMLPDGTVEVLANIVNYNHILYLFFKKQNKTVYL